jgi:Ca2+-binding EF-hand superfamily protein
MHEAFDEMATDRVLDVFKAWDADNTGTLSRAEFAKAMVRMGVKCTRAELFKLFNEIAMVFSRRQHSGDTKNN